MERRNSLLAFVAMVSMQAAACAQSAAGDAAGGDSKLPINRVVMFSSGVGYFQHRGHITKAQQSLDEYLTGLKAA